MGWAETSTTIFESEGLVAASVVVTYPPGGTGSFSVNVSTSNGTATAGEDYTETAETIVFEGQETAKPVIISLLPDSVYEADETFQISLQNAVGCTLAPGQDVLTVTIIDDTADTDSDGIPDYHEIHGTYGYVTDPNLWDTDREGMSDWDEISGRLGYVTDPTNWDTDGDRVNDLTEIVFGYSPLDGASAPAVSALSVPFFRDVG